MSGQPRVYAVAAVAACLGALVLSVASAWSQAPPPPTGGTSAPDGVEGAGEEALPRLEPTGGLTGGSGGTSTSPEPAPIPVLRASQVPPPDQPPPADQDAPERQQRVEHEAPLVHLKPKHDLPVEHPKPESRGPAPLPALTPVATFAQPLPATGMEWWTLALTGLALLAMGAALRSAAALRPA
jgi:outer membrane biosynthesis protein TonB